jgi:hypothetical protein
MKLPPSLEERRRRRNLGQKPITNAGPGFRRLAAGAARRLHPDYKVRDNE